MLKKFKRRISKWKEWRKYTWFNIIQQLFVLVGLKKSYYFDNFTVLEDANGR